VFASIKNIWKKGIENMNYRDTMYSDLKSVCTEKYGNAKGLYIYNKLRNISRR
jgi:hypothetical protein